MWSGKRFDGMRPWLMGKVIELEDSRLAHSWSISDPGGGTAPMPSALARILHSALHLSAGGSTGI